MPILRVKEGRWRRAANILDRQGSLGDLLTQPCFQQRSIRRAFKNIGDVNGFPGNICGVAKSPVPLIGATRLSDQIDNHAGDKHEWDSSPFHHFFLVKKLEGCGCRTAPRPDKNYSRNQLNARLMLLAEPAIPPPPRLGERWLAELLQWNLAAVAERRRMAA